MMIVACYLVLSRVPFVHDFGSITPLFSDHTPNTGVPENNKVTLSKSRREGTRDRNQTTRNNRHSQAVKIRWTIREPRTAQVNVRSIVPERVTHMFAR
jgi:hypothetical protein